MEHRDSLQKYRLCRLALDLGDFTVNELSAIAETKKGTIESFISKLRNEIPGAIEQETIRAHAVGRPIKRYRLTQEGMAKLAAANVSLGRQLTPTTYQKEASVRIAAAQPSGVAEINEAARAPVAATSEATEPVLEELCRQISDFSGAFENPELLKGYRVLSFAQDILGQSCVSYLAELGAEVFKIEAPWRDEAERHTTLLDRNQYSIYVDFHKPEGEAIVKTLAAKSDVVVEDYTPPTLDSSDAGYRKLSEVNPRLVYCRLGRSDARHSIWLADCWGGLMGALRILAALHSRDLFSGEGTFIDLQRATGGPGYALPLYGRYGIARERWGNWDSQLCVHGIIKCGKSSYPDSQNPQELEEDYILISAYEDKDFASLCKAIGDSTLASKYAKADIRVKAESQMDIYPALEKWAADKTKEQVAAIMDANNIINQPVWNAKEVADHPHWNERGAVRWLDDPTYGELLHQAPAFKMSGTPARLKWSLKPVGADNEYILGVAGFSPEEQWLLEEKKVILPLVRQERGADQG